MGQEKQLLAEVLRISDEIRETTELNELEAMKMAVEIQKNRIANEYNTSFGNAFLSVGSGPSALEAIAMQLGYMRSGGSTIVDALFANAEKEA